MRRFYSYGFLYFKWKNLRPSPRLFLYLILHDTIVLLGVLPLVWSDPYDSFGSQIQLNISKYHQKVRFYHFILRFNFPSSPCLLTLIFVPYTTECSLSLSNATLHLRPQHTDPSLVHRNLFIDNDKGNSE